MKIAALAAGEPHAIPKNAVVFRDPWPTTMKQGEAATSVAVRFDEEGKLDTRTHGTIVRFRVVSPNDGLRRVVQVNWLGGVEVLQEERKAE